MSDIRWVKLSTDTLDDEKIQYIEGLPEGQMLFNVWMKLIIMAGRSNQDGYLFVCEGVPYNEESLANKLRYPQNMIRLALNVYEKLKMIELINGVIHLSNWHKHQNIEGLDKIREQTRLRVAKYRNHLALPPSNVTGNVTVTLQPQDGDIKNKNIDIETCNVKCNVTCNADGELFRFYEDNFGKLTEYTTTELLSLKEEYSTDKLMEAMKECVNYNGRNLAYLKKVLNNGNGSKNNGNHKTNQPLTRKYEAVN